MISSIIYLYTQFLSQIWYPLGLRSLTPPAGDGQFIVDISETLELKIKSVRAYQTQFPPEKGTCLSFGAKQSVSFRIVCRI